MKEDVQGAVIWKGIIWIARGMLTGVYVAGRGGLVFTLIR